MTYLKYLFVKYNENTKCEKGVAKMLKKNVSQM